MVRQRIFYSGRQKDFGTGQGGITNSEVIAAANHEWKGHDFDSFGNTLVFYGCGVDVDESFLCPPSHLYSISLWKWAVLI